MKNFGLLCLLALILIETLCAETPYFYGGDNDPSNPNADGLINEDVYILHNDPYGAATFQNFYATSDIAVTGLFTNNYSSIVPDYGYWEIRSGVSEGNGGTLIASGALPVTNTPTGRHLDYYDEYNNTVSGLNVHLPRGQYWFAVVPSCPTCMGDAFNSNTFGLNSIGQSDLNLEYLDIPNGARFENANTFGDFPTFSSGLYASEIVPEPGSLTLLGAGAASAMLALLRRRI
jgi:hypothetical protein